MICKNRIETCILPYVKQIASPGSMQEPLVAQTVKTVPAMPETQVRSLCWENLLEKEMATHSRIFAWRIPWTEETSRLQSIGSQRVRHD